jgi:hypothetical protein
VTSLINDPEGTKRKFKNTFSVSHLSKSTSTFFFAAGFFRVKNYDSGLGSLETGTCVDGLYHDSGPVHDFCSCSYPDYGSDLDFGDGCVHDHGFGLGFDYDYEICSGFYGYGFDFEIYA